MLRLVWTDMTASATIGTRSGMPTAGRREVVLLTRSITYDLRYAIPAVVVLAAWVGLILGRVLAEMIQRHLFPHLRRTLTVQASVAGQRLW